MLVILIRYRLQVLLLKFRKFFTIYRTLKIYLLIKPSSAAARQLTPAAEDQKRVMLKPLKPTRAGVGTISDLQRPLSCQSGTEVAAWHAARQASFTQSNLPELNSQRRLHNIQTANGPTSAEPFRVQAFSAAFRGSR